MATPYLASLQVTFDFSNGAGYGVPLQLGDAINGLLGTNTLGITASQIVDISSQVVQINISGGRNLLQSQFEAARCVIRLLDPNGNWNPQNPSSPYYPNLVPLRKLRVAASYLGVKYYLFSGYSATYTYTYPTNQQTGYLTIECFDAFRLFNMANISAIAGASAGQDTGARINAILDQIGWPSTLRAIDTGNTLCQADPATNRSALQALKNCEFSEFGAFYVDDAGVATFINRTNLIKKAAQTPTVFNQSGGIPYKQVVPVLDDKLIINQATIGRIGGTPQIVADSASAAKYFSHSITQTSLVLQSDTDALNLALAYVEANKETTIRFDSLVLDLAATTSQSAVTVAALALNNFSPVTISNTTPQGSTITKTLEVMGTNHDITPTSWITTLTTAEPIIDGFILDSTLYAVLDTGVLAY